MVDYQVILHLNNHPGTCYESECGTYTIDENRKYIAWQNGMPCLQVDFSGLPTELKWKVKNS